MKKLNKLFLGAASVASVAAPIAAVISCGGTEEVAIGYVLALDGYDHSQADKSFNQQAYEGINAFTGKSNAPVVKPASPSGENEFKQMYSTVAKGSTIIAPGFLHIAPLTSATEEIEGKNIVLLDGTVSKPNIASIEFKVEQAAYLAGYALAEYASTAAGYAALKGSDDAVKISTFGGMDFPTVTGYMAGFKSGVEAGKVAAAKDNTTYPNASHVSFLTLGSKAAHFSGGFAAGGGITVATNLKNAGADVILPVAGPQTADVVSLGVKVIGVDSAQELQFPANSGFLFSILKDLKSATTNTLKLLAGQTVDASYKGLGSTTFGDLDNGLVGVSNLTQDITTLYNATKADQTVFAAAKAQGTTFTI